MLNDGACDVRPNVAPAGIVTFNVSNGAARHVTSVEVQRPDGLTLAQQANIAPGESGTMVMQMAAGTYIIACPGAGQPVSAFEVTSGGAWERDPLLVQGAATFRTSLQADALSLGNAAKALSNAIDIDDVGYAARAYRQARVAFTSCSAFLEDGTGLVAKINGPVDPFATRDSDLAGFPRVQAAIWRDHSLEGMRTVMDALSSAINQASAAATKAQPTPADMLSAAVSSLSLATTARLSGEQEAYSGLTLILVQADLDFATTVYKDLRPAIVRRASQLAAAVEGRLASASTALSALRASPGVEGSGYVEFAAVTPSQRHELVQDFDALFASLSFIDAQVLS
ncbi:MAG: imelysin family protein [Candidatus Dormibacteria bacterium]